MKPSRPCRTATHQNRPFSRACRVAPLEVVACKWGQDVGGAEPVSARGQVDRGGETEFCWLIRHCSGLGAR